MSFDLYFVDGSRPFQQSMELLEQQALTKKGELSAEELDLWAQLLSRVQAEMPDVIVEGGNSHIQLEDPTSLTRLALFSGGQLSAHSPHWYDQCCAGAARGAAFATYALAVEEVTGLIAYDPQTNGRFSQFSVQWFDHDPWQGELVTFVSPEAEDMTALRKTKDQDWRRVRAYEIVATAPDQWTTHSQRNATQWLAEIVFDREPYVPKRDQVALRYGQQMHKRNGFRLDLIRNVPDLVALLGASSDEQLLEEVLAMKTPEFLEAKAGNSPVEGFYELWQQRVDSISDETAAAVVLFRGQVVSLLDRAETSKRKVLTLSRWKGWFPPN